MPLIYINYPEGTFPEGAIDALADDITTAGLECEELPNTPFVRSTTWIYATEFPAGRVYHGGKPGGTKVISFEVNVVDGGLDAEAKKKLIASITDSVRKHADIPADERVPAYVLIRDVPAQDWGLFGVPVVLDDLRNPPDDAKPV